MAGKHRAKTTGRQTEVYAWLGTGAVTLALGAALAGGSGVASADTASTTATGPRVSPPGNASTTAIRTTISAQSTNTSTHSPKPKPTPVGGERSATSVVSSKDSVVRNQNPAVTGDHNPGPSPTLAETAIALNNGDLGTLAQVPGLGAINNIPFIDLAGGGGGGLLSKIAGALTKGMF
jgi:hypothetical protein